MFTSAELLTFRGTFTNAANKFVNSSPSSFSTMDPQVDHPMTDSSRKRPRSDSSSSDDDYDHLYPPEIWEQIFRHLSGLQLLRMRLVCRRWRDIITGSPPLMNRFRIVLENFEVLADDGERYKSNVRIDRDYNPTWLLPLTSVDFRDYCIDVVDGWWPWFGQKLTYLCIYRCELDMELMFEMLRETPNLRKLGLRETWLYGYADEPDFQLAKMEELSLEFMRYDPTDAHTEILDHFRIICPRLKRLQIQYKQHPINVYGLSHRQVEGVDLHSLSDLIQATQRTLEGVEVDDPAAVDVQRDLESLRLKQVGIHLKPSFVRQVMATFFRAQPLIEELVIYVDEMENDKVLCNIGQAVPKLKRLTLRDWSFRITINVDFLNFMPNLEYLSIYGKDYPEKLVISNAGNPRLKELYVDAVEIEGFMKYLERSPQIRSIVLDDCFLVASREGPGEAILENVKTFESTDSDCVPPEMLKILYQQCPLLEDVTLGFGEKYNDAVVLMTCEMLKHLRKLAMSYCWITDACVDHIIEHGLALEEFKVGQNSISDEAIERLRATRNIRVILSNW